MMKSCGIFMRILAVVIIISMGVILIAQYSMYAVELNEAWEDLEEDIESHEEEMRDSTHKGDCSKCEYYEERETSLERNHTNYILTSVQNFLETFVFCAILFVAAEIVLKLGSAKTPAIKQEPTNTFCPICGNKLKEGDRFCGACGTVIKG